LKIADAHGATITDHETRFFQQADQIADAHVTVTTVKARKKASFRFRVLKVNDQNTSAWLYNSLHFTHALQPCFAGQVMEHDRAQRNIEVTVRERDFLRQRLFEHNLCASLSGFLIRPRNHLRRSIDSVHRACGSDLPFGCNCKASCATAHI
jgi:hypothetical protein